MSETTNESKATFPETINPFPSDPIIIEQLEKVAESFFNSIVNKNDIDKPKEITTQAKAEEKPTSSKKVQICLPQSDKKIKVSSNKGTNNKRATNKASSPNHNKTSFSSNGSASLKKSKPVMDRTGVTEVIKISNETEKEKKNYEQKVLALKNRIAALKKQEDELNRQLNKHHEKERNIQQIKEHKDRLKQALTSAEIDKKKELEERKKKNEEEKKKIQLNITKKKEEIKNKKKIEYKQAMLEKTTTISVIKSINEETEKYNQSQFNKIKALHDKIKEEELKKQIKQEENVKQYYEKRRDHNVKKTEKLKKEMAELEKLEEECMKTLKTTQQKTNMIRYGSSYGTKQESTARKLNFDPKEVQAKVSTGHRSKSSAVRYAKENDKVLSNRNMKGSMPKDIRVEKK